MIARRLAQRFGAKIVERRGGMAPFRCVISELETRGPTIVLYRDTLELLAQLVVAQRLPFEPQSLDEIAIAHECFHLRWSRAPEERAHEYARALLQLPASPALLESALRGYLRKLGS